MNSDGETTPAWFLAQLGETLTTCEGVDVEIARLLVEHIIKPVPAKDCVEQTTMAIKTLAAFRVTPPKVSADE